VKRLVALAALCAGICAAAASAAGSTDLRTAQRYVARHCHPGSRRSASMWVEDRGFRFEALYGDCGGGDGHEQRIWFFRGSRFVGTDSKRPSAEILAGWRDLDTLAFLYVLYRPTDPLCCPTGGAVVVRYRWRQGRIVRLDPLPPWTASKSRPGRYP